MVILGGIAASITVIIFITSPLFSDSVSFQSCSLTHTIADMKLGRNVARTFLDYYRLNPLVERVAIPMPRLR